MAVEERPNMPATSDEWPNWRLALPVPLDDLPMHPLARRVAAAMREGRSEQVPAAQPGTSSSSASTNAS